MFPSVITLCLAATPPTATAPEPARDAATAPDSVLGAAQRAAELVAQGQHDAALELLESTFQTHDAPALLYMQAAVEHDRDRCDRAIPLYDRFLARDIPTPDADEARARRDACQAQVASRAEPQPAAAAPRPTDASGGTERAPVQVDAAPPGATDGRNPPWARDPLGGTLAGLGVAITATGGVFFGLARSEHNRLADAADLGAYDDRARRVERWSTAGIATVSVGGVTLAAALIRYTLVARRTALAARWPSPLQMAF